MTSAIQLYQSDVGFVDVRTSDYSDGTPMVKGIFYDNQTLVVRARQFKDFITAMAFSHAAEVAGHPIKHLVLPYLPGARQDRQNLNGGDVLLTADFVGIMLAAEDYDSVTILDPHSPSSTLCLRQTYKDKLKVVGVDKAVSQIEGRNYVGVIAPDKGSKERAELAGNALGVPVFYGSKVRDTSSGKLTGFSLEALDNKPNDRYLVVDDICDGGGTFLGLADEIDKQGSIADLYVSHGIFSQGTRYLAQRFGKIYSTDSIITYPQAHVTVLPIVKDLV